MVFSTILRRFMEKSPVPVIVQVLLERVLSPEKLNGWFERTAVEQYTRELLFSTVFELMNLVVVKTFPSVHAAYQESAEQIGVSIASVYNKLNGLESGTSAALVRDTAREKAEEQLKALQRYVDFFDSCADGILVVTLEGGVLFCNPAACVILDAKIKGLTGFDDNTAYEAMRNVVAAGTGWRCAATSAAVTERPTDRHQRRCDH